jgi:hypothetical protein
MKKKTEKQKTEKIENQKKNRETVSEKPEETPTRKF